MLIPRVALNIRLTHRQLLYLEPSCRKLAVRTAAGARPQKYAGYAAAPQV